MNSLPSPPHQFLQHVGTTVLILEYFFSLTTASFIVAFTLFIHSEPELFCIGSPNLLGLIWSHTDLEKA